jgi:hypothetical protein
VIGPKPPTENPIVDRSKYLELNRLSAQYFFRLERVTLTPVAV